MASEAHMPCLGREKMVFRGEKCRWQLIIALHNHEVFHVLKAKVVIFVILGALSSTARPRIFPVSTSFEHLCPPSVYTSHY